MDAINLAEKRMDMGNAGCVKTNTYEMDYYCFGSGERKLVIIPGVSMKPTVPLGLALEGTLRSFAEMYTIYLFDRKRNMTEGYSIRNMADDTADAMVQLGIRDAYVYAVSQGAMIAMTLAIHHKELVHLLYISSTQARSNDRSRAVFAQWLHLTEGDDCRALYNSIHENVYSPAYLEKYAAAFARLAGSGSREEMARFRILVEACLHFDIYDLLPQIACPVFVTGSKADRITGPEGPQEIAARLNCPCFLYDGYSHAVYDEAPDYFGRMYDTILAQ